MIDNTKRIPKVRIARPKQRPFQLRYTDVETGREVRLSTGCRDEQEAERQKQELEAKLLLRIDPAPGKVAGCSGMPWDDFRERYSHEYLPTLADRSVIDSESRLDIAERILRPRWLSDVADRDALQRLQSQLLAGSESRRGRPRSPHTVRSHMATILSVLNWARRRGWLESVPAIVKLRTSKLKQMKGRPLATEEYERMLDVTPRVVGEQAAPSWQHLLRGLWTSALRLDELMHVHWTDETQIMPVIRHGLEPVLRIPAQRQKNRTDETIPLVPWFEELLTETDAADRTGWAFQPQTLQSKFGRQKRHGRPTSKWVGRIVSRIGKAAGIVVDPGDQKTEKPPKFASAHDLRRSCAENLIVAGVPIDVIQRILRHSDFNTTRRHYATGNARREARILRETLGVPRYSRAEETVEI